MAVVVAAPSAFTSEGFDVPAEHTAVTIAYELENAGKAPYLSEGFTTKLASSEECQGFAYLSEGVSGAPEVVAEGDGAAFTYGYFCQGKRGDQLTLEVRLDPNSAISKIKTEIP